MTIEAYQQPIAKVLEYWRVIARHKWQTLLATSAMMLVFTVIIAKLPNEYEATTTILVDPQQVPERYVSPAVNSDAGERLNTITQEVLSRTRLQDIITRFKLYAELTPKVSQEEIVEQMRDHIRIQVRQGSGPQPSTFTITFRGKNPTVVAAVANELATSFIRWNVNSREQQVEGTQEFLSSELQTAKRSLEEQEDKLRVFRMNHLGETPDQTETNLQAMVALRSTLQANIDSCNRLEQERLLLTRLPQGIAPTGGGDTGASLTTRGRLQLEKRQLESDLRHLREQYSEKYPDLVKTKRHLEEVDRQLSELPPDVPETRENPTSEVSATTVRVELIDKELKRLNAEQDRIQAHLLAYQGKLDAAPVREQQMVELTRNYDVSKQHYQTLLDKSFNIEMAASLEQKQKAERFTVLDSAQVPQKPVSPRRKMLLVLTALLSAALPCLTVVGKEMLRAAVTTEAELKSLIPPGVRIVGLIPHIETSAGRRRNIVVGLTALVASFLLCASSVWVVWQMRPLL
jgi:polysaccharide chain length determinant protein (PEP-CTERM system associated)